MYENHTPVGLSSNVHRTPVHPIYTLYISRDFGIDNVYIFSCKFAYIIKMLYLCTVKRWVYIVCLLILAGPVAAKKDHYQPQRPNKALCWFYRTSEWIDHYLTQGIDTDYITLPEHSWRLAFNTSMVGINSSLDFYEYPEVGTISLLSRTSPSVDLGFYAGYRTFGGGYSWDAIHAYSQKLSLSLGSKRWGLDFSHQKSTNIQGTLVFRNMPEIPPQAIEQGFVWISNTNLNLWYALNSAHYSHNAAIKQSYIQKRTAGSLLLHLSYLENDIHLRDTINRPDLQFLPLLMGDTKRLHTYQLAAGIGYGINYTPNHGKVLLHLSANALLVCYSINQISYASDDTLLLAGEPRYDIKPQHPVHVTGNVRGAVSWEINPWVHLSLWAQANNIRFNSKQETENDKRLSMNTWNWQTHLSVGVRFGAGKKRVQQVLDDEEEYLIAEEQDILRRARWHKRDTTLRAAAEEIKAEHAYMDSITQAEIAEVKAAAKEKTGMSAKRKHRLRHTKLPQWVTDYIYSPRQ